MNRTRAVDASTHAVSPVSTTASVSAAEACVQDNPPNNSSKTKVKESRGENFFNMSRSILWGHLYPPSSSAEPQNPITTSLNCV